jgi:predicted TIM-barrel fold metal-dependent hydrolase
MRHSLTSKPKAGWAKLLCDVQEDPIGLEPMRHIGPHKVLWASDYPHPESTLGYSAQTVRDIFAATGDEAGKQIAGGNAVEIRGL